MSFFPPPFTPLIPFLPQGHTLLTRLSGAQPAVLSAAIKSHASKPAALSSSSQQPIAAQTVYQPGEQVSGSADAGGAIGAGEEEEEYEEDEEELEKRCHEIMKQSDVVLFMKGDRDTPRYVVSFCFRYSFILSESSTYLFPFFRRRCGFSQKIVGILGSEGIDYTTFDILSDEGVRQSAFFVPSSFSPFLPPLLSEN
jgi:glutaredoxin-related protein